MLALLVLLPALELFAATFALLPMTVAFAPQTVGTTSAPVTITLNNNNKKASLQFTLSTSSPADFLAVDSCGGLVPASGTCSITVTFRPSTLGNRTATLTVVDVNKSSNKDTVRLSGTGVGATTLTPST